METDNTWEGLLADETSPVSGPGLMPLLPNASKVEAARLARRRAAALKLIEQARMASPEGRMVQTGGGVRDFGELPDIYVAPNAMQQIASAGSNVLADYQADKANKEADQAESTLREQVQAAADAQEKQRQKEVQAKLDAVAGHQAKIIAEKNADQEEAARVKRITTVEGAIKEGELQFEKGMEAARQRIRDRKHDEEVRANRIADRNFTIENRVPPSDQLVYDAQGNAVWANPRTHTITPVPAGPTGNPAIQKPLAEQEKKQQTAIANYDSTLQNYKNLLADYDPQGKDAASLAKRKAIDAAYSQLLLQGKELANLGALTGPDVGLMEQLVTNPTGLRGTVEGAAFGRTGFNEQVKQAEGVVKRTKQNFETQHGRKVPTAAKPPPPVLTKKVVREVKLKDGRIGVEYSDGSRGFK